MSDDDISSALEKRRPLVSELNAVVVRLVHAKAAQRIGGWIGHCLSAAF